MTIPSQASRNPVGTSTRRERVLFVHNNPTRFVNIDLQLLRERFDVQEWYQRSRWVNVVALARDVRSCDAVFGWFASWHTFLPAIVALVFRRPFILVAGGYDTASIPEIGYGHQRGGLKRWVATLTMRSATSVIANSEFTKEEAVRNAGVDAGRISVVHHGIAQETVYGNRRKKRVAMTVGNIDRANLQRKGIEPFVQAAALLPDIQFVVVGRWLDHAIDRLRSVAPPNVQITGYLSDAGLQALYDEAMVYVQASRHEGFGVALAEAMMAGCVPVVSRAGALPEVVGDTGVYIDAITPETIAAGIREAMTMDAAAGERVRSRIADCFPLVQRGEGLARVIEKAMSRDRTGPEGERSDG